MKKREKDRRKLYNLYNNTISQITYKLNNVSN